jgi:hypothetical protein
MANLSDRSDENLNKLYHAIGIIVIWWSYIEQWIDMIVAFIYQHNDGKQFAPKEEIPVSFRNKIKFIRKSLQNLSNLSPIAKDGLILMEKAMLLSKRRHDIIHSTPAKIDQDLYEFNKTDYTINKHVYRTVKFTISDFRQLEIEMTALASELIYYMRDLAHLITPLSSSSNKGQKA